MRFGQVGLVVLCEVVSAQTRVGRVKPKTNANQQATSSVMQENALAPSVVVGRMFPIRNAVSQSETTKLVTHPDCIFYYVFL